MQQQTAITVGSIAALAQTRGASLAESFLSADAILLVDVSGSMGACDAPGRKSRFEAAETQLKQLQAQMPGRLAVIGFSSVVEFAAGGIPIRQGGGTDMAAALRFVQPADDTGVKFILISDGEPNDEAETLAVARSFQSPIDTIFIGPEDDLAGGRLFLERLASLSGGKSISNGIAKLDAPVRELLTA